MCPILKVGPIGCPETSVRNYHCAMRNISEKRRSRNCSTLLNPTPLHLYINVRNWDLLFLYKMRIYLLLLPTWRWPVWPKHVVERILNKWIVIFEWIYCDNSYLKHNGKELWQKCSCWSQVWLQITTVPCTLDLTVSRGDVLSNYRYKNMWQGGFIFAAFENIWFVLHICWKCFSGRSESVEELFFFKKSVTNLWELAAVFPLLSRSFLRWAPLVICRFSFGKTK